MHFLVPGRSDGINRMLQWRSIHTWKFDEVWKNIAYWADIAYTVADDA